MARIVNAIVGIIEAVFLLRLALQLFGASPTSQFVTWIYQISNALAQPFQGAFPVISFGNNSVVNLSIILAMVCYGILGWLLVWCLSFIFRSY